MLSKLYIYIYIYILVLILFPYNSLWIELAICSVSYIYSYSFSIHYYTSDHYQGRLYNTIVISPHSGYDTRYCTVYTDIDIDKIAIHFLRESRASTHSTHTSRAHYSTPAVAVS